MFNLLVVIALTLSGFANASLNEFDIRCKTPSDTALKGIVGFDEVGWSAIGLPLADRGKLKVFNYFRVGDKKSLSFVDRSENGWNATNSFSWFSIMLVMAREDRKLFSENKPFKISLFRRSYSPVNGVAQFGKAEILKCERLN